MLANEKFMKRLIWGVTVVVLLLVSVIFNPRIMTEPLDLGIDTGFLPSVNAGINFIVSLLLIAGFFFIKNKKVTYHKNAMLAAFVLSILFLLLYVLYHLTNTHTVWCEASPVSKGLYLFILFSHIGLSTLIVPLTCFTVFRGLSNSVEKHRKIAKITLPLWLYITITGVLVYLMISPCYS